MLLSAEICLFAALTLVSPREGETIPILREGQRAYLAQPEAQRHKEMDQKEKRDALSAVSAFPEVITLKWTGSTEKDAVVKLQAEGGEERAFAVTNAGVVQITNLEVGRRYTWSVMAGDETASGSFRTADEAPRLLFVEGIANARDLGGRKGVGGRRLRQGRIFRSDGLRASTHNKGSLFKPVCVGGEMRVTEFGRETLVSDLAVRFDLELRRNQETMNMIDTCLGRGVAWKRIEFTAYEFVDDPMRGRLPFAEIFRLLLDERNYPILFHCAGGRDRTGTLAYLLQGVLGVSRDELSQDWEMSVFADAGMKFRSSLIRGLEDYLARIPGTTWTERCEGFVRSCGISPEEIQTFRERMLEP